MSVFEIFEPGARYWREQRELDKVRFVEAPAPGPGPDGIQVDLDAGTITVTPVSDPQD